MKKLFRFVFAVTASIVAVSACVETPVEEVSEVSIERVVNFNAASPVTKTAFTDPNGNSYPVVWTGSEVVKAILNFQKEALSSDDGV